MGQHWETLMQTKHSTYLAPATTSSIVFAFVKADTEDRKNPDATTMVIKRLTPFDRLYRMTTGTSKIKVATHAVIVRLIRRVMGPGMNISTSDVLLCMFRLRM